MRRKLFQYSDTQRTARFVFKDGSKKVLPQYWTGTEWKTKAGPNEWGAYREEQVTGQEVIYEFEGEKCAEIGASDGLAAISHPGFAHKVQQIAQRYRRLKAAVAKRSPSLEQPAGALAGKVAKLEAECALLI